MLFYKQTKTVHSADETPSNLACLNALDFTALKHGHALLILIPQLRLTLDEPLPVNVVLAF
jgi:hypothetical protein